MARIDRPLYDNLLVRHCKYVAWGGHTPLPLLAAWLAAWLNPDWIGQWAVRRRHGFLSQLLFRCTCIQTLIKKLSAHRMSSEILQCR